MAVLNLISLLVAHFRVLLTWLEHPTTSEVGSPGPPYEIGQYPQAQVLQH